MDGDEWPGQPLVTRLDGERLTCGLATQEEMASIREALDRMPRGLHPLGKYALAPPQRPISPSTTEVSHQKPGLPFNGPWISGRPC